MKRIYLSLLLALGAVSAGAQVVGTKTIGVDYPTLAAAITDVNTQGINGNVIINVPAGHTETAPAGGYMLGSAVLNASASSANTLTIQKSGVGANPILSSQTGTTTNLDGLFFVQGTDYVTIDGIDLAESAGNTTNTTQMEWGYALVKLQNTAPIDGCQNVTIKNCTITLQRTNTASIGIYANNHTSISTTGLTLTSATDAMSNCKFYSNTMKSVNTGISLRGANNASFYDQNNDVGGSSLATGNTIQNFVGASTGSGINLQYQNNSNVSYNNINNTAGGGIASTAIIYGVNTLNGAATSNSVTNNIINMTHGTSTTAFYCIYHTGASNGTIAVNNNQITASGGGTTVAMYMIYFTGAMNNIVTNGNIFYNINIGGTTSTLGLIYHTGSASPFNNTCVGNYTSGPTTPYVTKAGTGTFYGYYNNAGTTGGQTLIDNNNFSYITTGASTFYTIFENNGGTGQTKIIRNNTSSYNTTGSGTMYNMHASFASGGVVSMRNNRVFNITGGSATVYGVYCGTGATDTVADCHVYNLSSSGNVYGIYMPSTVANMRVYNDTVNTLTTSGASGLLYGMWLSGPTTTDIWKNKIYDLSATGATGPSINAMYLNSGTVTAWNNLVGDIRIPTAPSNGTQLVGMYCGGGTSHTLYYNTVYLNATGAGANFGSTAVYAATSNVTFRNNIFINNSTPNGTGLTVAYRRSGTSLTGYQAASNNNLFYAGAPAANRVIMYDGTNTYQTLADYKTLVASRDAASITENVPFQATTGGGTNFLRPSTSTPTQIESNCLNISGITDDHYGTVRAGNPGYAGSGAAPDLGAVEDNYTPLDLSAPVISYTPLTFTCLTGDRTFTATVTDVSGVATGGLSPRVYFRKNSGTWFSNAGVMSSGDAINGTWTFTITASAMGGLSTGDNVSYYVIAQDVATPNIGSNPLGVVATDVNNVTTAPSSVVNYPISNTLSGSYNVGAGQTYTTITSAVAAYNSSCLSGPVTFVLTDASYTGETFPITVNINSFASSTNTLTIRPAAGNAVTINGLAGSTAIFKFLNASNVTLDGVNTAGASITLNSLNTASANSVIWLASTASTGPGNNFISIKNLNINGGTNGATNNWGIVSGVDGASPSNTAAPDNDNITIQGNTVQRCGYAIAGFGTAAVSAGGLDNWSITGNTFGPAAYSATNNISYNGIYMGSALGLNISNNTIRNVGLTSLASQVAGIVLTANVNGLTINGNTIRDISSISTTNSTNSQCGISIGTNVINSTITRNTLTGFLNAATGGYGTRGIIVNTGTNTSNMVIANNMISNLVSTGDNSAIYWTIGIAIEGSSGDVKVYYNSVNFYGSFAGYNSTSGTGTACLYVNTTGTGIDVRNNIFSNSFDNTIQTNDISVAISAVTTTPFSNLNYNDYFISGTQGRLGNIGGPGASYYNTLPALQTAFGGNANSINVQPLFVTNADLHLQVVTSNVPLISGTPVTVTNDFDGTTRSGSAPVMGAHEVSIPNCSGTPTAGTVTSTATSGCVTFNTTLGLTGMTVAAGIEYQWQVSVDDVAPYMDIAGATNSTYAATVSSTAYYRAKVICANGGGFAFTPGLQHIVYPNPLPITGTATACIATTSTLNSATAGGTWQSGNTGIATVAPGTGEVTGVTTGTATITYVVTATGCFTTQIFTVNPTPTAFNITPATSTVCDGGTPQLLTASTSSVPYSAVSGIQQNTNTAASTTIAGYPAPLSMYYGGQRTQMLVKASELSSLGFMAGSTLTGFNFTVLTLGSAYTMNSYQVRVVPVTMSSISAFQTTGLTTLRNPANYSPVVGNNTMTFDNPYTWDGTTDLVFDFTFSNNLTGTGTYAAQMYNSNTSFQSTIVYRADGVTAATAASATSINFSYSQRPDFTLVGTNPVAPVWSDAATLYSTADGLTPYAGANTSTVYAGPSANTTYTATTTYGGCERTAQAVVSVNPMPVAITGSLQVCHGLSTTLTNTDGGGTWSVAPTTVATINTSTGIAMGVSPGTARVSYTFNSTGCIRTAILTVNALPAPIGGTNAVCIGGNGTLTDADAGGTWQSANTAVVVVGSSTGILTGVTDGTALITYTAPTSCIITGIATVYPLPVVSVTPTTPTTFCIGESTSVYSVSATMPTATLLNQDFNSGIGTWTYDNTLGTVGVWSIVPTGFDASPGDGTPMAQASAAVEGNQVITKMVSPSFSTIGYQSVSLTFNQFLLSDVSDQALSVEYSVNNGPWVSMVDYVSSTAFVSGTWSASIPEVTIALPAPVINQPDVKLRWHYNGAFYGWFLDNIKVTGMLPAPTYSWSGGSDLSCNTCTNPTITPANSGVNIYTATATSAVGCSLGATATINVNPLPAVIGGDLAICEGLTGTLTNADAGGTWVSANTTVATINGTTGVATGLVAGTSDITYTLPTGCIRTTILTINALPAAIGGTLQVCEGLTTTLTDATSGGTWLSGNTTVADIDLNNGVASGHVAGTSTITYTNTTTGCINSAVLTVNPLPSAIGGTLSVCEGLNTTLTDADAGGTWMSANTTTAAIGSSSGIATGGTAGMVMITYTLPTGCITSAELTVNALPAAIGGTLQACAGLSTTLTDATSGGTWTSGNTTVATIDGAGMVTANVAGTSMITYTVTATGCIASAEYTVNALPAAIGGTLDVCEGLTTTLTNATLGGTWQSANAGTATIDANTGVATGVTAGNVDVTYQLTATGCQRTAELTVNALPAAIAGTLQVCEAGATTLTNADAGGTWSSSDVALATIDASTGVVTGASAGNPVITYMLPTGCISTVVMTINALPSSITGTQDVCEGLTTTLTSGTSGGIWTSASTATATVGATSGVVMGVSAGNVDITYTLATSCYRVANVTVNALPAVVGGATQVCEVSSTTLTNSDAGGTWSSSNTSVASVVGSTGVVTGVAAGSAVFTYMLPTGCIRTHNMTVNALPLVYNVTGGGSYCFGGSGVAIGVSNTESGTAYNLYLGGTLMNSFTAAGGATNFSSMTAAGTYTVQAVSPASCVRAMSGDATVVILPLITPSVSLGTTPNDTVCAGVSTTFSATASNAGTTPTYAWEVNGGPVTSTGTSHSYAPANGDVITVTVTSSEACPSPASVSASQTMVVVSNETPVADITAQMGTMTLTSADTVCQGSLVTYTAASLFGGSAPVYTWYNNGVSTGATGDTYVHAPAKGDRIFAKLNSNYRCPVINNVPSDTIAIKVDSVYIPLVDIRINTSLTVKPATPVTFTATVVEGGPKPTFQWYRNNNLVVGASSNVFTTSTIANNDSFSVVVYGTGDCSFYTYNSIKMRVTNAVEDVADASEIRMVPNPTSGEFVVSGTLGATDTKEVAIEVIDMLGQVVYKGSSVAKSGQLNARVKLSNNLANGMYMLNVHNGEESKVFHFVLKQ